MKTTIGMACFDDFHGVYFTVQSARLHHAGRFDEIVVVDSNPAPAEYRGKPLGEVPVQFHHSLMTWDLCRQVGAKYVEHPGGGTASTRDRVFREAAGDVVVCVDCHVLLVPGFFDRLRDYYDANPGSADLLQGPILWDPLGGLGATHFDDQWDSEMWGRWGMAWLTPGGDLFAWRKGANNLPYFYLLPDHRPFDPIAALGFTPQKGETIEAALMRAKCRPVAAGDAPFEIPAMGLGQFACRRDAWLGFHPEFRGFGGEEHYIHEKFRRAGRRTLCVPGMGWLHRFGRPDGVKYPLRKADKARNYVLAFREFGWDLGPVRKEFAKRYTPEKWAAIESGEPVAADTPRFVQASGGCGKGVGLSLEEWYERAANQPSDINEHVPTLRELAAGCDTVVEFGTRAGVSTVGLLMGRPKKLITVDVKATSEVTRLQAVAPEGTTFGFLQGDSRSVIVPAGINLLFIDTIHTADHVWAELQNAGLLADRIAFHDTEIYGENGEGGQPGLLPAIRRWVKEHPEYSVIRNDRNNHGFMVLSRRPEDKPTLPPTWKLGWNYGKALVKDLAAGRPRVSLQVAEERLSHCQLCHLRTGNRCAHPECGCFLDLIPGKKPGEERPGKAMWASEKCPLGNWGPVEVTE